MNWNNNFLNELNELKFCEVSRKSISNRYWKFQLSILKNKKLLFLRKYIRSQSLNMSREIQKMAITVLIFSEGFEGRQFELVIWNGVSRGLPAPALLTELGFLSLTLILGWGSNRPSSAGELWRQSDCGTWIPSMQLKFLWQSRSNCFKEMEPTTFPIFYLVDTILILYRQTTMVVDLKV